MEKACMIIDGEGNVVEVGVPDCVLKRRDYWEGQGYSLEIVDKDEALRRKKGDLKKDHKV